MIRYSILIAACVFAVGCETTKEPLEKGESHPYANPSASNPGLEPLEKPSLEEDFYDAPKTF